MTAPVRWRCQICNELLNTLTNQVTNAVKYAHALPRDHEPDPVPVDEVLTPLVHSCDFCGTAGVVVRYPCEAVNDEGVHGEAQVGGALVLDAAGHLLEVLQVFENDPDFLACAACRVMIDEGNKSGLTTRAVVSYLAANPGESHDPLVVQSITAVHERFWQTVRGPAVEIT